MTALLINGSPEGTRGNTARLLAIADEVLAAEIEVRHLVLAATEVHAWRDALSKCRVMIIGTGTYWDSWGSPLQRFLEQMTDTEGTELWLGKPAGVIVSMHAVGGKGVLSRLQGVLNTFGALLPPMTGVVCSAVAQAAIEADSPIAEDLWRPEDIRLACHNLLAACHRDRPYRAWPVDRAATRSIWVS